MKPRLARTNEELQEASRHLLYEWEMLKECGQRLTFSGYEVTDQRLFNAVLTAFGVHSRNLLDFFYPPQNLKADDMVASDYFDDSEYWETIRPQSTELFEKTRNMVNKLNAHLTYMRAVWKDEDRWWLWQQIHTELEPVWNTFVANVSPEKLYHG